jgi:predicted Zn-dependent protease
MRNPGNWKSARSLGNGTFAVSNQEVAQRVLEAHKQMARTVRQITQTLKTMKHLTDPPERAFATHLRQELEAAQEALTALKEFHTPNMQMFAVVTASLIYASKAFAAYLDAWNADIITAKYGNGSSSLVQ